MEYHVTLQVDFGTRWQLQSNNKTKSSSVSTWDHASDPERKFELCVAPDLLVEADETVATDSRFIGGPVFQKVVVGLSS